MERMNIAGMSMKGGRKDNFFFCLFEYYADSDRWFLRSLLQVKDEEGLAGDEAIRGWIEKFNIHQLILDCPLSHPACHSCSLECPGSSKCPVESVDEVRMRMYRMLKEDEERLKDEPKNYEIERNEDDEIQFNEDILAKETYHHILSRGFKRRLKRGFNPYWNRPVDYFIWAHYYDQLMKLFNISYDSFGNTSLMMIYRLDYLRRHFPSSLELYEGNTNITFLELLRAKIVSKNELLSLSDIEAGAEARLQVLKKVEKQFKLFIYDHDMEMLVKHSRAFQSLMLALTGISIHLKQTKNLPKWADPETTSFVIPLFK